MVAGLYVSLFFTGCSSKDVLLLLDTGAVIEGELWGIVAGICGTLLLETAVVAMFKQAAPWSAFGNLSITRSFANSL